MTKVWAAKSVAVFEVDACNGRVRSYPGRSARNASFGGKPASRPKAKGWLSWQKSAAVEVRSLARTG